MENRTPPPLAPEAVSQLRGLVARMDLHRDAWGEWRGGEKIGENTYSMPWMDAAPIADEAMRFLYEHGLIVGFDWSAWDEGRTFLQRGGEDRFGDLDRMTVLKLLTSVARQDRFFEGAWVDIFDNGLAQDLFARLLETETNPRRP
jgi:hypothetical protein